MKEIVFLVKNIFNQGGDTRAVILLANELSLNPEYKIEILSLFKTSDNPLFSIDERIVIKNLFDQPFSLRRNYFKVINKFRLYMKENKVDIMLIEAIGFNCFTYPVLSHFKKVKTVAVEHASYFDGGKKLGLAWFGRKIACKHTDCVVVLTKKDLQDYKSNMPVINKIEQIYNPLDVKLKSSKYDLTSRNIITCGRLVHVKGYDLLLEVARKVFDFYPSWEWHIYGEGPEKLELVQKIKLYKLENNVKLMGEVTDLYERYQQYSFYVMTSRSESFGMVLIEALKAGIPVVSFKCPNGPSEIIVDEVNGLLVPHLDVDTMANKIIELIGDPLQRERLSKNSNINLTEFETTNITKKWIKLLEEI